MVALPHRWHRPGAFLQFGPIPVPLQLRQCPTDILEDFNTDGTNINGVFTVDGRRDQATVRRQHMMAKSIDVASFSLLADKRTRAPQSSQQFDKAASDLSSEQTRLSLLCWKPSPKGGSPRAIEDHMAGSWHTVALQQPVASA